MDEQEDRFIEALLAMKKRTIVHPLITSKQKELYYGLRKKRPAGFAADIQFAILTGYWIPLDE